MNIAKDAKFNPNMLKEKLGKAFDPRMLQQLGGMGNIMNMVKRGARGGANGRNGGHGEERSAGRPQQNDGRAREVRQKEQTQITRLIGLALVITGEFFAEGIERPLRAQELALHGAVLVHADALDRRDGAADLHFGRALAGVRRKRKLTCARPTCGLRCCRCFPSA